MSNGSPLGRRVRRKPAERGGARDDSHESMMTRDIVDGLQRVG